MGENLARRFRSNTFKETAMLRVTVVAVAILISQAALAANPSCEAQATEKKLSGAAKNSFVTKCEKDAKAAMTCDAQAAEKKLAGAAKTSFVTKCENDAKAAVMKTCEAEAADKKLAGAAKDSFTKKCVTDATAAAK